MTALARSRYALTMCAAIAILAGCGGGGNPFGSSGIPSAQSVVPQAIHADVTSVVTVLYKGKPTLKGSRAVLFNAKGEEVRRAVTGVNGNLRFPNVPQKLALRLVFQVAWEDCTGKFPNRTCIKDGILLHWPGVDKVLPPPFPATLECNYGVKSKQLCERT